MKKFLILFVFALAFPIFSQDVEIAESAIKDLLYNEKKYLDGKRRLRNGIIFTSTGVASTGVGVSMLVLGLSSGVDGNGTVAVTGLVLMYAGAPLFYVGVPNIIIGAVRKHKYKPQVAISPNAVKLAVEF